MKQTHELARANAKKGDDDCVRCLDGPEIIVDNHHIPNHVGQTYTKKLTGKTVVPNPINVARISSQKSDSSIRSISSNGDELGSIEEALAVARPVGESEVNIYAATEYDPSSKPVNNKRYQVYTTVSLLALIISVGVGVVFVTRKKKAARSATIAGPSQSPVIDPTTNHVSVYGIRDIIESQLLERQAKFSDMQASDPRFLALDWILHEDGIQDATMFQRYILAILAFSFELYSWNCGFVNLDSCDGNDINGDYSLWLSKTDECLWYGVSCVDGIVRGIDLDSNNLIGSIPPEIGGLRFLESLSLGGNCLNGTIPYEIWKLTSLSTLDIEWNYLSGVFPNELYELSLLTELKLAGNANEGSCYHSDGTVINLTSNGIEGDIFGPQIGQLSNLQEISVRKNNFNGSISSEIGTLHYLETISAEYNKILGVIPEEVCNASSLREVWLGENNITGGIPTRIGDLKALEKFSLTGMAMSGTIPDSLYNLTNLKALHLWNNDPGFNGSIKPQVGNLLQLENLVLNDNPLLTGTLPSELGLCQNLESIRIENTQLTGTVPDEVCALRDKKLNMEYNWFEDFFAADCLRENGTLSSYFDCICCSMCCDHTTKICFINERR